MSVCYKKRGVTVVSAKLNVVDSFNPLLFRELEDVYKKNTLYDYTVSFFFQISFAPYTYLISSHLCHSLLSSLFLWVRNKISHARLVSHASYIFVPLVLI